MHRFAVLSAVLHAGLAVAAPAGKLWQPGAGTEWHISLTQLINPADPATPDVPAYDLDLFDTDATTIAALQAKGKMVICYFSAGSAENWRPDYSKFQPSDLGNALEGWAGENWLNVNSANVRSIMSARIDLAAQKGCNAIDPDNVDGYGNDNGLSLTQDDAVDYVNWMAGVAAAKGISTGLKNAGDIIPRVLDNVHFSVNEQCHAYNECPTYQPFITANKPVFNIEYPPSAGTSSYSTTATCPSYTSGSTGFSTVVKKMDLDNWTQICPVSGVPAYASSSAVQPVAAPTSTSSAPADSPTSADSSTEAAATPSSLSSYSAPAAPTNPTTTDASPTSAAAATTDASAPQPTSTDDCDDEPTSTAETAAPASTSGSTRHHRKHGHGGHGNDSKK